MVIGTKGEKSRIYNAFRGSGLLYEEKKGGQIDIVKGSSHQEEGYSVATYNPRTGNIKVTKNGELFESAAIRRLAKRLEKAVGKEITISNK